MTAIRIIDDHVQLANIGSKTHAAIEGHIQGIGNYAFPAADGIVDQILKTNGAGVLAWIDKNHSIASHNDTTATGAELETLTDNSIADALHRHSELVASDGSPDPALSVDATGKVGIGTITPGAFLDVDATTGGSTSVAHFTQLGAWTGNNYTLKVTGYTILGGMRINGADKWRSFYLAAAQMGFATGDTSPITFTQSVSSEKMRIHTNGNVGIGTTAPVTSALLELSSTTGALLLTRMTTTQKNALTAVNGMLVYDSTLNKFQGYENGAWTSLI